MKLSKKLLDQVKHENIMLGLEDIRVIVRNCNFHEPWWYILCVLEIYGAAHRYLLSSEEQSDILSPMVFWSPVPIIFKMLLPREEKINFAINSHKANVTVGE